MSDLRAQLKTTIFGLLGKDPEAVIVSFLSGPDELAQAMLSEVRRLIPDREHFAVVPKPCAPIEGVTFLSAAEASRSLRRRRIALAPVLFTKDDQFRQLRRLAFKLAPTRILAYNERLERHHLRLRNGIASYLFVRGVPLDRIFLRPKLLYPLKHDRSLEITTAAEYAGKRANRARRRIGILTPYFPYPLSHGGAVRIFNLLREAATTFDIYLFAFSDPLSAEQVAAMQEFCVRIVVFPKPRYREPRWSTVRPPEVNEFTSQYVQQRILDEIRTHDIELLQLEYTHLGTYSGEVLVEHDVTYDLYRQVYATDRSLRAWWDWWRWRRFERKTLRRRKSVVVMSDKDAQLLGIHNARVIPNGVDLHRFQPEPEPAGNRVLFVGSFSHFPNVVAFRFLIEEVWPIVLRERPDAQLAVVAGPDAELHWARHTSSAAIPDTPNTRVLGFVSDVRPLYREANLVVVPTRVSAGTNLKVLEAMAMMRAVVSTSSGCAGLGLEHGQSVWIADAADQFGSAVLALLHDEQLRARIAREARRIVESQFGWEQIGARQRDLWNELLPRLEIRIRKGTAADLGRVQEIESCSDEAAHWDTESYLYYDFSVACVGPNVAGFIISRMTAETEREILNIAVSPEFRRMGIATALIHSIEDAEVFLEVRESNRVAQKLYENLGFEDVGRRPGYYDAPPETAIVMRKRR